MYSLSLFNKATEFGSKLKTIATSDSSNSTATEIENLKTEIEHLKKEITFREEKYHSWFNEIAENESKVPLSNSEYEILYNKITKSFKTMFLTFFDNDQFFINCINEAFINPTSDNFFDKLYQLSKCIRSKIIFSDVLLPNKEHWFKWINKELNWKILEWSDQTKETFLDTFASEESISWVGEIFNWISKDVLLIRETNKENMNKINNYEDKFKSWNDSISKMQTDCREAYNTEKKWIEIKNNLEKNIETLQETNTRLSKQITGNEEKTKEIISENQELSDKVKLLLLSNEKFVNTNEEWNLLISSLKNDKINWTNQIKELEKDIELYSSNNEALNEKNAIIVKKEQEIANLRSSYKFLEESKINYEFDKNKEMDLYKKQILEMSNEITGLKELLSNSTEKEEIEKIYWEKIEHLETQLEETEKNNKKLQENEIEIKREMDGLWKKVKNDLKETEYLIDKRVISSVLVNYFDKGMNESVKEGWLETLSAIMDYSNEDRKKMGWKPISIPRKKSTNCNGDDKNDDKWKNVSDGLYNFILNS